MKIKIVDFDYDFLHYITHDDINVSNFDFENFMIIYNSKYDKAFLDRASNKNSLTFSEGITGASDKNSLTFSEGITRASDKNSLTFSQGITGASDKNSLTFSQGITGASDKNSLTFSEGITTRAAENDSAILEEYLQLLDKVIAKFVKLMNEEFQ
ncbi:hypothetical protein TNCT_465981 [Trichonephila clavata]|uniref:Uncharacterized protein n=1 Tax=Trichonephila clavata TaxID=2740835 RepID=A0A8X6FIT0_TRICU|nr:hypothetical protein TNCT_229711 [Trichonephila clavata]GFQ81307.1 hypothetical protein TNCT_20711 [Trichonephila clavata]GFQ97358.1 hypothetical protein TNCT_465981 [Trichonephila clavata]